MKAIISSITVEPAKEKSYRFVIALQIPGTPPTVEFFSTPLNKEMSVRIAKNQVRHAIPSLIGNVDPFREMLANRSKFIGKEVEIEVTPQLDDQDKPKINPTTRKPYTNVRLVANNCDLTPDQINALLGAPVTEAAAAATEAKVEDLK